MTINEFIEKAVKGGWKPFSKFKKKFELEEKYAIFFDNVNVRRYALNDIFLDPLVWRAVGKVEGWLDIGELEYDFFNAEQCENPKYDHSKTWHYRMHRMEDALTEGKTIEQFLQTL